MKFLTLLITLNVALASLAQSVGFQKNDLFADLFKYSYNSSKLIKSEFYNLADYMMSECEAHDHKLNFLCEFPISVSEFRQRERWITENTLDPMNPLSGGQIYLAQDEWTDHDIRTLSWSLGLALTGLDEQTSIVKKTLGWLLLKESVKFEAKKLKDLFKWRSSKKAYQLEYTSLPHIISSLQSPYAFSQAIDFAEQIECRDLVICLDIKRALKNMAINNILNPSIMGKSKAILKGLRAENEYTSGRVKVAFERVSLIKKLSKAVYEKKDMGDNQHLLNTLVEVLKRDVVSYRRLTLSLHIIKLETLIEYQEKYKNQVVTKDLPYIKNYPGYKLLEDKIKNDIIETFRVLSHELENTQNGLENGG